MKENVIISLADSNYFELLNELVDSIKRFKESIPAGRAGKPEDIAELVEFLLNPKSRFICGSVLFIDGGHDAMLRADQF